MDGKKNDDGSQFRSLADQLPALLWSTDGQLRITSGSGGGLAALGRRRDQSLGMTLQAYFGTSDENHIALKAHRRALLGESSKYELEWAGRWYETYVEPFRNAQGEIVGTIGMALDMTARKKAEDERAQLQDRLRRQHKLEAIGQLASGLAHEINNPLQSIINFAQLIRARVTDDAVREYAEGISHEVQSLASIVRNLQCLVHQKAELPVELRLSELVQGTVSLFGALLRKDGIALDVSVPSDLRPAWGNAYGVQQVLINLVMAAREGLVRLPPDDPGPKRIAIGAGAIEEHSRPFVRLSVQHRHATAGMSARDEHDLRLAISLEIAHFNAGELRVESSENEHRAFHLILPLACEQ